MPMRIDASRLRIAGVIATVVAVASIGAAGWWFAQASVSESEHSETDRSAPEWKSDWVEARAETPEKSDESETAEPETTEPETAERSRAPTSRQRERRHRPGQQNGAEQERVEYDPAILRVVTNFGKADVTVNGLPYPEYTSGEDDEPGMVLPAGGPYTVQVTYNGKKKTYELSLRPYQVRYLMVDLTGFKGGAPAPSPSPEPNQAQENNKKNNEENGRVTVYSKPKGQIRVDGQKKNQETPGTVEVEPGQHNIQVKFENGQMSESKTVRVRKGSRIKLFFRKND